jgi:3D (Asp-Asp-Asp) domain-containing protein
MSPGKLSVILIILLLVLGAVIGVSLYRSFVEQPPNKLLEREEGELNWVQGNSIIAVSPVYYPDVYILGVIAGRTMQASVSAYNSLPEQTWGDPFEMANGERVYEGAVANNCLEFGTVVKIKNSIYVVKDRMNSRYGCGYFDIFLWSYKDAINWGRQSLEVTIY